MTCEQCRYHSYVYGAHFCDSRNNKRKTIRISETDTKKDIECWWADKTDKTGEEKNNV